MLRICSCNHDETKHKNMDIAGEEHLQKLVNSHVIFPVYQPNTMKIEFYTTVDYGVRYTTDDILRKIESINTFSSPCRYCGCKVFKADNLKTLEKLCERTTSSTIR